MPKLREYVRRSNYDCQYYFDIIYENDCERLSWFDKRSTNHWANGRLTELNAGYLGETIYFEVNSYNNMNFQQKRTPCNMYPIPHIFNNHLCASIFKLANATCSSSFKLFA